MTTPARWRALHWYADHEINVNAVKGRPQPSTRMRNFMLIEQQLDRVPVGAFGHHRFVLTAAARGLLERKGKRQAKRRSCDRPGHALG
jgi:hypothetical protein